MTSQVIRKELVGALQLSGPARSAATASEAISLACSKGTDE
jgi:hypothetical protein